MAIPIYYTLVDAIIKRKPSHFAYPVLVTAVYMFVGMIWYWWHPGWLLYLTVPVYYGICDMFKTEPRSK